MTEQEARRGQILNLILEKRCSIAKASELLGVSERQVWRRLANYRQEGLAALVHGNRGRAPANATPPDVRARVVALAKDPYDGANDTHLSELLAEREGITVSRQTVQRLLRKAGFVSPRRHRAPAHRSRRERYPQEGMLLQMDGSQHRWLGPDGPRFTLIAAIDDATGTVPYALFRKNEDAHGYFLLLREIIRRNGLPLALYSDRHSIFTVSQPATTQDQLEGKEPQTQFGRAMETLGIGLILAHSPQAKGRIERLWGTFQDRLVQELRLANARTMEEANQALGAFLDKYNGRFSVPPAQPGKAYRPLQPSVRLDAILCFEYARTAAMDNTVSFGGKALQIKPDELRTSYARTRVTVQERLDGRVVALYQGRELASTDAPPCPVVLRARKPSKATDQNDQSRHGDGGGPAAIPMTASPTPRGRTPAPDHPWRTKMVSPKSPLLTKSLSSITDIIPER